VRKRLPVDLGEAFWLAVRGNLTTFADVKTWIKVVEGRIAPGIEDPGFLADAAKALPSEPWTDTTWKTWTGAVSVASGRKGRALFHPLRLALTAQDNGPEMAKLLPLIGRTKAEARLKGQSA
jgi:glutamyl-tRNA synthetase